MIESWRRSTTANERHGHPCKETTARSATDPPQILHRQPDGDLKHCSLLVRELNVGLVDVKFVVERLVAVDAGGAAAATPLARKHVDDLPHARVEESHRAHNARLVSHEKRERGEKVVGTVPRRDLGRERWERPKLGDGGDAIEGSMPERVASRATGIVRDGPDKRCRQDWRVGGEDAIGRGGDVHRDRILKDKPQQSQ